ncbi:hypothetical protein KDD30_18265 (plasmid) [Photobacterium sp. GJ3]|uniref:hypothetical protein n=1 Tax=Photobacterium sp. GJ3 TaxID=2829502 RepID=UPI001B8B5521|nr:hypothetical protein [Photobacterium sp. GJ3]QUJ70093.1 hypothetical protein KDD30_18265 [Photobacterium sp. GJ3]
MKKLQRIVLIGSAIGLIGVAGRFLFSTEHAAAMQGQLSSAIEPESPVQASNLMARAQRADRRTEIVSEGSPSPEPEAGIVMPVEMKAQFAVLSQVYASELTHPAYSRPLTSADSQWLNPNQYELVATPVLDGQSQASLRLEKFRFFYPEPVSVTVQSDLAVEGMQVELIDVDTREQLANVRFAGNQARFASRDTWPQEIRIKATVDFESGTDTLTSDFRFEVPVAELTQIGLPAIDGAHVNIPGILLIERSGIYRIRGNLFTQSGQPVAVLTAKQTLQTGEQGIQFQAHQSVFSGGTGPETYELRTLQIEKMSGFPGEQSQYGISRQSVWPLGQIDTGQLSNEAYQPTAEEQSRIKFLQSAASG